MTTTTVKPLDQLIYDLFVTACEGGINYWAVLHAYRHSVNGAEDHIGFHAWIGDHADEAFGDTKLTDGVQYRGPLVRIDRAVIARGLALYQARRLDPPYDHLDWSSVPAVLITAEQIDNWDFDAGDADNVVQLGLFGTAVFG